MDKSRKNIYETKVQGIFREFALKYLVSDISYSIFNPISNQNLYKVVPGECQDLKIEF